MHYARLNLLCPTLAAIILLPASACLDTNPEWDPPLAYESGPDPSTDDGVETGSETGDGDGDGDGELVCKAATPSFGPCPDSCDECYKGVCWRYCSAGDCDGDFMLCPVSWSCRIACIGHDSCKDSTIACTGAGSCEVDCLGDHACENADVLCADGPCTVTCAGGYDDVCRQMHVSCGTNTSSLHCKGGFEGGLPSMSNNDPGPCQCTSDCTDDEDN